ncbi:MAG: TonB-dependent receptor, partial [Longimicrobiales bacterium]
QELVLPNARIEADTSGVRAISGAVPPDAPLSADALAAAARKATEVVVRLHEQRAAGGASGPEPVFYIGGASGPEPVFYIDGERVADHSAALKRLDPEMIERIEVLKGAAASLYGPQHTAGVVQIYTKKR